MIRNTVIEIRYDEAEQVLNKTTNENYLKDLENLLIQSDEFREVDQKLNIYCPFEASGMVRMETKHAAFLAHSLNPHASHGFDDHYLRCFLARLLNEPTNSLNTLKPLDLHLANLGRADIRREWKNIDLLIVIEDIKSFFAFEMKIDASESSTQLSKYKEILDTNFLDEGSIKWKRHYFFLTPDGHSPKNPDSVWQPIDYSIVADAISDFFAEAPNAESLPNIMLKNYAAMLEREHMKDNELSDLAARIWSKHSEALKFLMDYQPSIQGDLIEAIRPRANEFVKAAKERGVELTYIEDKARSYVRFKFDRLANLPLMNSGTGWKKLTDQVLLVEFHATKTELKSQLIIGPTEHKILRETMYNIFKAKTQGNRSLAKDWSGWFQTTLCTFKDDPINFNTTAVIEKGLRGFESRFMKSLTPELICELENAINELSA